MSTNLPFNGNFKTTCIYRKVSNTWKAGFHTGMDLVGISSADIYSVCDGKVIMAQKYGDYGNAVKVKDSSTGKIFLFAHLKSIAVKVNQTVSRTTKIGVMGNTGHSSGTHLHIEMRTSADKYGIVENIAEYMGIPNVVGTYNSSDYSTTYKQGDVVETNFQVRVVKEVDSEHYQVESNGYYFELHKSMVKPLNKDNIGDVIQRGTICAVKGNGVYVIEILDRQFDIKEEYISKKL